MTAATLRRPGREALSTATFGMWVFLASEMLFFGVLFFGYAVTRLHHPAAFAVASRHTNVTLGTLNTALLLTSSLTMALAVLALERAQRRACVRLLGATLALGGAFLAVKLFEYGLDAREGLLPWRPETMPDGADVGVRLFFVMYYVMTGAHAVHLIVGLGFVALMIAWILRADERRSRLVQLTNCGLYWHLIDVVWIFLYPLLYLVSRT